MTIPKVLIGCPTYESYSYCVKEYLDAVRALTYPKYDLLLVDNSETEVFAEEIRKKGVRVIHIPWNEDVKKRIEISRNIIREEVLKGEYDYFLSLEQDVIPPKNIIEKLMGRNADVAAGIYYYPAKVNIRNKRNEIIKTKEVMIPLVARPHPENQELMLPCSDVEVEGEKVFTIRGCGLGCVLIARKVLEKITFRFVGRDDAQNFSNDCWENKYTMVADTSVKCMHLLKNKPVWVKNLLKQDKS